MAFNFGAGNPNAHGSADGSGAAPAPGGFSFSAPAPTAGGSAAFGSSATTTSTAPTTSTATAGAAATASANNAGFSFRGGNSVAAPTAPTGGSNAAASSSAPSATSGTGGFSFGNTTNTAGAAATPGPAAAVTGPTTGSAAPSTVLTVPSWQDAFPMLQLYDELVPHLEMATTLRNRSNLTTATTPFLAAQQVQDLVEKHIQHLLPSMVEFATPNTALRQHLSSTMTNGSPVLVMLRNQVAQLSPSLYQQAMLLADDLKIDEATALALLDHIMEHPELLRAKQQEGHNADQDAMDEDDVRLDPVLAVGRRLYLQEQQSAAQMLLLLFQHAIQLISGGDGDDNHASGMQSSGAPPPPPHPILQSCALLLSKRLWSRLLQTLPQIHARIFGLVHDQKQQQEQFSVSLRRHHFANDTSTLTFHLEVATWQRRHGALLAYFVAYTSHLVGAEVVELLDLVQNMTNGDHRLLPGLRILDPFVDVPSPYENDYYHYDSSQPFTAALKDKSRFVWQQELVQQVMASGQADLLRDVGILTMAVVVALDNGAAKLAHSNATTIVASSSDNLEQSLRGKITREAALHWKRTDVLGIVMQAYACYVLDHKLEDGDALTTPSPRAGGSGVSSPRSTERRRLWRDCLQGPQHFKTLSFARCSLIAALNIDPTLQRCPQPCDVGEFLLSSLAGLTARYLHVLSLYDRPISRAKWLQDAEEELRLRRSEWHQQRALERLTRTGPPLSTEPTSPPPTHVDLMERIDCMDDVIALAVALCEQGSDYALMFWDHEIAAESGAMRLVPSRALRDLERLQQEDDSLTPSFLFFLAGLGKAGSEGLETSAARIVYTMLQRDTSHNMGYPDWEAVLGVLRWYVRELCPDQYEDFAETSRSNVTSNYGGASAAYYYFESDTNLGRDARKDESSAPLRASKELGQENVDILRSHLKLLKSVAQHCSQARLDLLRLHVRAEGSNGQDLSYQDSMLSILFGLVCAPLPSALRGTVLGTIAALLSSHDCDEQQRSMLRDFGLKAWDLVEASQILPIYLFEQYRSVDEKQLRERPGLLFPPTSIASLDDSVHSWIPPNSKYSIIFEMEFLEAQEGVYAATEGFLTLLRELVRTAGLPTALGHTWRRRPGCSPYIEYILHLLLPRIVGGFGASQSALPFRTEDERFRLCSAAVNVLATVVNDYVLLASDDSIMDATARKSEGFKALQRIARTLLCRPLADNLVNLPHDDDIVAAAKDFEKDRQTLAPLNSRRGSGALKANPFAPDSLVHGTGHNISGEAPRPVFPALLIICDILSLDAGRLADLLVSITTNTFDAATALSPAPYLDLAHSTFHATAPNLRSAQEGKRKGPTLLRHQLLRNLFDDSGLDRKIRASQRSQLMASCLQLLCATIVRIESFGNKFDHGQSCTPVLKFAATQATSRLFVQQIQSYDISNVLCDGESAHSFLRTLEHSIKWRVAHDHLAFEIVGPATSILFYLDERLRSRGDTRLHAIWPAFVKALLDNVRLSFVADDSMGLVSIATFTLRHLLSRATTNGTTDRHRNGRWGGESLDARLSSPIMSVQHFRILAMAPIQSMLTSKFVNTETSALLYKFLPSIRHEIRSEPLLDLWANVLQIYRKLTLQKGREYFSVFLGDPVNVFALSWIMSAFVQEFQVLQSREERAAAILSHRQALNDIFWDADSLLALLVSHLSLRLPTLPSSGTAFQSALSRARDFCTVATEYGYAEVDNERLIDCLSMQKVVFVEDELRTWCKRWNDLLLCNAAIVAITESMYVAASTFLDTSLSLAEDGRVGESVVELLGRLLRRFEGCHDVSVSAEGLLNLAKLASTAAARSSELMRRNRITSPSAVSQSFAGAILAGTSLRTRQNDDLSRGAIGVLADGWAVTLATDQQDVDAAVSQLVIEAAAALAEIACETDVRAKAAQAMVSKCRRCLTALFDACSNDDTRDEMMIVAFSISRSTGSVLKKLVQSVSYGDNSVLHLLCSMATSKAGASLLIDAGVLSALASTSSMCCAAFDVGKNSSDNVACLVYVQVTARLLMALMDHGLERGDHLTVATQVFRICGNVDSVAIWLASRFPLDGDVLKSFMLCLSVANERLTRSALTFHPTMSKAADSPVILELNRKLARFVLHMAEYPLPASLLPSLPAALISEESPGPTDWWKSIDTPRPAGAILPSARWGNGELLSSNLCDVGTNALQLAAFVFSVDCLIWDPHAALRALCRCVDASRVCGHRDDMDRAVSVFRGVLDDFVVRLLLHVTEMIANPNCSVRTEIILSALDHTRLEVMGLHAGPASITDENSSDLSLHLSCLLREELDPKVNANDHRITFA